MFKIYIYLTGLANKTQEVELEDGHSCGAFRVKAADSNSSVELQINAEDARNLGHGFAALAKVLRSNELREKVRKNLNTRLQPRR